MDASEPAVLYGIEAIASFLGLPPRSVKHKIDTGILPTFKMGRSVCATPSGLRTWLADTEAKAIAEREAVLRGARAE